MLSFITLLSLIPLVFGEGEIDNVQPQKNIKCGETVTFKWTFDDSKPFENGEKRYKIQFRDNHLTDFTEKVIFDNVVELSYPATEFTYTFPSPLSGQWIEGEGKVLNDGKEVSVKVHIEQFGNPKVNSEHKVLQGEFSDPGFKLSCCPIGSEGCPCSNGGCEAGLLCRKVGSNPRNKVEKCVKAGEAGKCNGPCNNGACDEGACDATGICDCAKPANDCPGMPGAWQPGPAGCPCSTADSKCAAGFYCSNSKCYENDGTSSGLKIGEIPCPQVPATAEAPDACIRHPESGGSNNKNPYSCAKGGKCDLCTPGEEQCICNDQGQCNQVQGKSVQCVSVSGVQQKRCFTLTGCQDCPCGANQSCNSGLACASGKCKQSASNTGNTQNGGNTGGENNVVDANACPKVGAENCPCAINGAGKEGCTEKGLVCRLVKESNKKLCVKNSASSNAIAFATAIVASFLMMF